MFICPTCKKAMRLPRCSCGYTAEYKNNIWQLTDAPDLVTDGDGDKYIGYEHIGLAYSGSRKYRIENADEVLAKEISRITGDGVFLDLGCGDGCFTVPCAANGTRVIAGDISNAMLTILQGKAECNRVSLENVMLCRMNALAIPLTDESVDTVVANSVLHLISNPQKVLREICRVLKRGGAFICVDDVPGKVAETPCDNTQYLEIVNAFYREYWNRLGTHGIYPKKYSWKFDRNACCDSLFGKKTETLIERNCAYEISLGDVFLPRMIGRGFSDQTNIPQGLHEKVIAELLSTFRQTYGNDFTEIKFRGIEQNISVTVYHKI